MGYYNNYNKKLDYNAYKRVSSEKVQPKRFEMFRDMVDQGSTVYNTKYYPSPIYYPVYNQMPDEHIGCLYDFLINNPIDLERILYNYFVINIENLSKQILYLNNSEMIYPTDERVNREKVELLNKGIICTDAQIRAHIMSNYIIRFSKKAYDSSVKHEYSLDNYTYGVLFVYIPNEKIYNCISSKTPEEQQKRYNYIFNNIHYPEGEYNTIMMSVVRDYYLYTNGFPLFLIFHGSRAYRKKEAFANKSYNINKYECREVVRKIIKEGIKDGASGREYKQYWFVET